MKRANVPVGAKRLLVATASNWPSTAALPRLFARAGMHVTVLCHPAALIALSRYAHDIVPVHGGLAKTVDTLREHLHHRAYDWIIAGDDPFVAALLREPDRGWLRSWFPFDPDNRDAVGFATSKHAFLEIARAADIPIADFVLCETWDAFAATGDRFGYPFVAKDEIGHAGGAIRLVRDPSAARALWDARAGARLAAQRFIRGRVGTIEVLYEHGAVRAFMGAYKVDCHPSEFGAASAKQPFTDPALLPIARSVGAATGYHGIGAIDIMRDETTGAFYVLELNPRPSGGGFALTERIATAFHREFAAFLRGEPSSRTIDLGYAGAPATLFPNNWYYFVELADKRRPRVWRRAFGAFVRAPFDDLPLIVKYLRVFVGYYAERSPLGTSAKAYVKRALGLRSVAHPGARN